MKARRKLHRLLRVGPILRARGVQSSLATLTVLTTLSAVSSLPWILWVVWAGLTAAAVVSATGQLPKAQPSA